MKTTRQALTRSVALPDSYDSFFSFPVSKGGYSGVAVYTSSQTSLPLKAEEGLSGLIQPRPPLSPHERISSTYPSAHTISLMPSNPTSEDPNPTTQTKPTSLLPLDSEGRALVLDFDLFVLINLYCPNETSDARLPFKLNYHRMLEERVRILVEKEGREVIVVGDMNVCADPIDHGDGHLPSCREGFWEPPCRAWFHEWLEPRGRMIDVVRRLWPDRKDMYTCERLFFLF